MNKLSAVLLATLCFAAPLSLSSCATAKVTQPAAEATEADRFDLKVAKGEILQFIFVKPREGEAAAQVRPPQE
ncbi:MAG: hypothetical protein AAFP97_11360 [Pseudomonadota bacterium]